MRVGVRARSGWTLPRLGSRTIPTPRVADRPLRHRTRHPEDRPPAGRVEALASYYAALGKKAAAWVRLRGLPRAVPQMARFVGGVRWPGRPAGSTALDMISAEDGDRLVERFVRRGRVMLGDGGLPAVSLRSSGSEVASMERARVRAASMFAAEAPERSVRTA